MASFTYYLNCPQCGGDEMVEVRVHASKDEDLWASAPKPVCACTLTEEETEDITDDAMELAVDDLWAWAERTDDDERYDRRRDWDGEE